MIELIALWLFFCVLVGLFASQRRNRSGIAWFLVSFIFSPLVGFLLVAILRESDGTSIGPAWLTGTDENRPWSPSSRPKASGLGQMSNDRWARLKAKRT
jgi:hypothetical protein